MTVDPQPSSDPPDSDAVWEPGASQPTVRGRAARFIWIVAAIVLVLFGGCAGVLGVISAIPRDQMVQQMVEQNPDLPAEQVELLHTAAPALAVVVSLLFVLPAVVLVFAGFAIRRGRPWGHWTAIVILALYVALLGVWLVRSLIALTTAGALVELVLALAVIGSLLALMFYTLRLLWQARRQPPGDDEIEPWNRHLWER